MIFYVEFEKNFEGEKPILKVPHEAFGLKTINKVREEFGVNFPLSAFYDSISGLTYYHSFTLFLNDDKEDLINNCVHFEDTNRVKILINEPNVLEDFVKVSTKVYSNCDEDDCNDEDEKQYAVRLRYEFDEDKFLKFWRMAGYPLEIGKKISLEKE